MIPIQSIECSSYLLNGGTSIRWGGMEIPTNYKQALTKGLSFFSRFFSLSRYIRIRQMFVNRHFFHCLLKTFCFHPLFHRPRLDFRKISWAQFENEMKDWGWANGGIKKIFQHMDRHTATRKMVCKTEWQQKRWKENAIVIYV